VGQSQLKLQTSRLSKCSEYLNSQIGCNRALSENKFNRSKQVRDTFDNLLIHSSSTEENYFEHSIQFGSNLSRIPSDAWLFDIVFFVCKLLTIDISALQPKVMFVVWLVDSCMVSRWSVRRRLSKIFSVAWWMDLGPTIVNCVQWKVTHIRFKLGSVCPWLTSLDSTKILVMWRWNCGLVWSVKRRNVFLGLNKK
jgi:hypothetical protein